MVPKHLNHKPIVAVDNYNDLDGHYVHTGTDVESLSVGYAQFDNANPNELTAKVFRYDRTNDRWCRQSEELPLHRCVDLCNLMVQSILEARGTSYSQDELLLKSQIENEVALEDIKVFYEDTKNQMQSKLRELMELLKILNP